MAFQKMVATVEKHPQNRAVRVMVEHDPYQSYSRAVKPRAFKELKEWAYENFISGTVTYEGVDYDPNGDDWRTTGRAQTAYIFSY